MKYKVITWDVGDEIDIEKLNETIQEFDSPYIQEVEDTGGSFYAVVVTEGFFMDIQGLFRRWSMEILD